MSDENEADVSSCCCASCGIAEIDDVKLKECDDCDLVRYCSDECLNNHRSQHEEACKKRAAELREKLLFKQPEGSHLGDCPICSLPMPLGQLKCNLMSCCSKIICMGCCHANQKREREQRLQPSCPFCRKPAPKTYEEADKRRMARVEANDPVALRFEGIDQYKKGDYIRAFEFFTKAAELGDAEAHYKLAMLYHVEKDEGKFVHHLQEAAIGGHPFASCALGVYECYKNKNERAVKHWIISATLGLDQSIKALMQAFKKGFVEKEVLAAALRAHKAAVDAIKSPQRDQAEESIDSVSGRIM